MTVTWNSDTQEWGEQIYHKLHKQHPNIQQWEDVLCDTSKENKMMWWMWWQWIKLVSTTATMIESVCSIKINNNDPSSNQD